MRSDLYKKIAEGLAGELVRKHETLGDSFFRAKDAMQIIYPNGVPTEKYGDALVVARILNKLMAIAYVRDNDKYFHDILGLCLLRLATPAYEADAAPTSTKEITNEPTN